jgi:hypothetical protein
MINLQMSLGITACLIVDDLFGLIVGTHKITYYDWMASEIQFRLFRVA